MLLEAPPNQFPIGRDRDDVRLVGRIRVEGYLIGTRHARFPRPTRPYDSSMRMRGSSQASKISDRSVPMTARPK